jgi:hypothetical protein
LNIWLSQVVAVEEQVLVKAFLAQVVAVLVALETMLQVIH